MPRLVVLVLEGAAPSLIDRWQVAGGLPTFSALERLGTRGPFESQPVPYEPSALASAFTGARPGDHGCFSYWHCHGQTFAETPQVIQPADIGARFLWQRPEADGLRVGIVNLWGQDTRQPVNGHLIGYPMYPTLRASYPSALLRELSLRGIHYGHDVSVVFRGEPRDEFVGLVERVERHRAAAFLDLLARGGDLFVCNITLLDRVSHFFWREVEPDSGVPDEQTALWRAYHAVDNIIGAVLDRLEAGDHLFVFSEIGFGPLERYVSFDDVLAEAGLATVASEAPQGSHGINLNLRRRYADGQIGADDEDRAFVQVQEALLAARIRETGGPLVRDVVRGAELYPGPRAEQAPDLVIVPADERYLPLGHPFWAKHVHRHLQTGWHRRDSLWVGIGPHFDARARGRAATCEDVLPTLAACLELPISVEGGSPLTADRQPVQEQDPRRASAPRVSQR
jgi:predicted AlkP superfamily phosphohydrolase/phosphomutase